MAKLPFALKAGHPLLDRFLKDRLEGDVWEEVDTGVWGHCYPLERGVYAVTLMSRDCGQHFCASGSEGVLEAIRQARRIREDQHEVDVERAMTPETPNERTGG